jgi:hypothetical protein
VSEQNARDTQFAGFAKLLFEELKQYSYDDAMSPHDDQSWEDQIKRHDDGAIQIMTQRAYDLVYHAHQTPQSAASTEEVVRMVPDITAWPKEAK